MEYRRGRITQEYRKMMVEQTAPHSTRDRAAEAIINHAAKAIEIEDIDARVSLPIQH
jgi:hypothetical protein